MKKSELFAVFWCCLIFTIWIPVQVKADDMNINIDFRGDKTGSEDGIVHNNWGTGAPAGVKPDNFTGQYEQNYRLEAGNYYTTTYADDRVKTQFDDKVTIDHYDNPTSMQEHQAVMHDVPEDNHQIKTDYKEDYGDAAIYSDTAKYGDWTAYYYNGVRTTGAPDNAQYVVGTQSDIHKEYHADTPAVTTTPTTANQTVEQQTWAPTVNTATKNNSVQLDWDSTGHAPIDKISEDNYSAKFTTVQSLETGDYAVTGSADDLISVQVDGQTVLDNWNSVPSYEFGSTFHISDWTNHIDSGAQATDHVINVLYHQWSGPGYIHLRMDKIDNFIDPDKWLVTYFNNEDLNGMPVSAQSVVGNSTGMPE